MAAAALPPTPDLVASSEPHEGACRALADAKEGRAWVRCSLGSSPAGSPTAQSVDDRVDAAVGGVRDDDPVISFYAALARGEKNDPDVEAMVYDALLAPADPVGPYHAHPALQFMPSRRRRVRYLERAVAACQQGALPAVAREAADVAARLLADEALAAKVRGACAVETPVNVRDLPKFRARLRDVDRVSCFVRSRKLAGGHFSRLTHAPKASRAAGPRPGARDERAGGAAGPSHA